MRVGQSERKTYNDTSVMQRYMIPMADGFVSGACTCTVSNDFASAGDINVYQISLCKGQTFVTNLMDTVVNQTQRTYTKFSKLIVVNPNPTDQYNMVMADGSAQTVTLNEIQALGDTQFGNDDNYFVIDNEAGIYSQFTVYPTSGDRSIVVQKIEEDSLTTLKNEARAGRIKVVGNIAKFAMFVGVLMVLSVFDSTADGVQYGFMAGLIGVAGKVIGGLAAKAGGIVGKVGGVVQNLVSKVVPSAGGGAQPKSLNPGGGSGGGLLGGLFGGTGSATTGSGTVTADAPAVPIWKKPIVWIITGVLGVITTIIIVVSKKGRGGRR